MDHPEARSQPAGQMLDVNGTRVHAYVEGEGPVVILIHGASGNLRDFTFDLVGRLSGRYRVIAFDRPAHGLTDPLPGRAASPQQQAVLLAAAAAQLGVRRAVIVGHSYGGAVAMAWALERPGRVAAVVSLAGAVEPWEGELDPWYRVASSWLGGATVVPLVSAFAGPRQVRQTIADIFAPDPVPRGYVEYIGAELSLRPSALRASARQVNTLKPHLIEMAPRYPSLGIPIEIVHGSADTTVGLEIHSRRLAQQVPGARLTVLDGAGHMPHHANPGAVVAAIARAATRAGLR
jgi:pimeloyl-ACP methyl ester carboxylesterase